MSKFKPSYLYPPGESLQELLEEREIAPADFASLIGITLAELTAIFEGSAAITPELAESFVAQLGGEAQFWLNYERLYRKNLAQRALVEK